MGIRTKSKERSVTAVSVELNKHPTISCWNEDKINEWRKRNNNVGKKYGKKPDVTVTAGYLICNSCVEHESGRAECTAEWQPTTVRINDTGELHPKVAKRWLDHIAGLRGMQPKINPELTGVNESSELKPIDQVLVGSN